MAVAEFKLGHVLGDGADLCGAVTRADIGIKAEGEYALALTDEDVKAYFLQRKHNSHKGTYGSACIMAGSEKYIGAAALCLMAASRSGCGYVRAACPVAVRDALVSSLPQVIFSQDADLSADALAIGSGCGADEKLYAKLKEIFLSYKGKLIIDADGLNALAAFGKDILKNAACDVIITPHVKEFSRLTCKEFNTLRPRRMRKRICARLRSKSTFKGCGYCNFRRAESISQSSRKHCACQRGKRRYAHWAHMWLGGARVSSFGRCALRFIHSRLRCGSRFCRKDRLLRDGN